MTKAPRGGTERVGGSGIVYCLTIADAYRVGRWLKSQDVEVEVYTGATDPDVRLGIEERLLEEHGAVSRAVAEGMASNVRQRLGTSYGIGINDCTARAEVLGPRVVEGLSGDTERGAAA